MSLSDNYSPDVSLGNGSTLIFTGNWKVFNASYFVLQLQEIATGIFTTLTLGSEYTLTFSEAGYSATLLIPAPSSDYYIIRSRSVELSQTNPYRTSKGFQGRVIEDSFDKLTAIDQDQQDQIDRAMKFQVGSLYSGIEIEDPIDGRALKWDVANNKIVNSLNDPDQMVTDSQQYLSQTEAARDVAIAAAGTATTQAGVALGHANTAQSWAIDPIGSRPQGSAKYWAEQAAAFSPPNNNWTATVDPTVTNDQNQGWTKGSQWYNTVSSEIFVCASNTVGAAVWIKTTLTIDEIQPLIDSKQPLDPRVQTAANGALTPTSTNDICIRTALSGALTINNPSGTMVQGQALIIRLKDNGTARAITWGSNYRAIGVTLPTTTVISKTMYVAMVWNATDTKFDVTGVALEA